MIQILDVLVARPGRMGELRELLLRHYVPGAEARGMRLVAEWVEPAVGPDERGGEWILLWGVADVAAWWAMRAQASVAPAVAAFWRDADACLATRMRRMLPPFAGAVQDPPRRRRLGPGALRGRRATALLGLPGGAGDAARTRLETLARALPRQVPGCLRSEIGRNLPGTLGGGDFTLDLVFEDAERAARWLGSAWRDREARSAWDALVERVDAVHYEPLEAGLDAPGIASPVKRTLLLRVEPGAPRERVARFERELAAMPDHIPAIRNWHLARVAGSAGEPGPSGWTHVWAQEFETLDGLQRDYMVAAYHWAVVDRWFDPESPERVVAPDFAHVFCAMPQSVLG